MKIAFIYDAVYPWIKGNAEKRIYEIGGADKGHRVHWFGVEWWFNDNDKQGIEYENLHGYLLFEFDSYLRIGVAMKIVFIPHATGRMKKRGITKEMVLETIKNPEKVV